MTDALALMLTTIAGVAWLTAAACTAYMIKHRAPGVTVGYLLTHGLAFFSSDKFTHEATRYRGWFLRAAGLFFVCVLGLGVLAALHA